MNFQIGRIKPITLNSQPVKRDLWGQIALHTDVLTDAHVNQYDLQQSLIRTDKPVDQNALAGLVDNLSTISEYMNPSVDKQEKQSFSLIINKLKSLQRNPNDVGTRNALKSNLDHFTRTVFNGTPLQLDNASLTNGYYKQLSGEKKLRNSPNVVSVAPVSSGETKIPAFNVPASFHYIDLVNQEKRNHPEGYTEDMAITASIRLVNDNITNGVYKSNPGQQVADETSVKRAVSNYLTADISSTQKNKVMQVLQEIPKTLAGKLVINTLNVIPAVVNKATVAAKAIGEGDNFSTVYQKAKLARPGEGWLEFFNGAGMVPLVLLTQLKMWREWKEGKQFSDYDTKVIRDAAPYFQKFVDSGAYQARLDAYKKTGNKIGVKFWQDQTLKDQPGIKEYLAKNRGVAEALSELGGVALTTPLVGKAIEAGAQGVAKGGNIVAGVKARNFLQDESVKFAVNKAMPGQVTEEVLPINQVKGVGGNPLRADLPATRFTEVVHPDKEVVDVIADAQVKLSKLASDYKSGQGARTPELHAKHVALMQKDTEDALSAVVSKAREVDKSSYETELGLHVQRSVAQTASKPRNKFFANLGIGNRVPAMESASINAYHSEIESGKVAIQAKVNVAAQEWQKSVGAIDSVSEEYIPQAMSRFELINHETGALIKEDQLGLRGWLVNEKGLSEPVADRVVKQANETRKLLQNLHDNATAEVSKIAQNAGRSKEIPEFGYQERYWFKKPDFTDSKVVNPRRDLSALFERTKAPTENADFWDGINYAVTRDAKGSEFYNSVRLMPGTVESAGKEAVTALQNGKYKDFWRVKNSLENFHDAALPGVSDVPDIVQKVYDKFPFIQKMVDFPKKASVMLWVKGNWPSSKLFNWVEEGGRSVLINRPNVFKQFSNPKNWDSAAKGFADANGNIINFGSGEFGKVIESGGIKGFVKPQGGKLGAFARSANKGPRTLVDWNTNRMDTMVSAVRNMVGKEAYWEKNAENLAKGMDKLAAHEQAFRDTSELVNKVYIGAREGNKLGYAMTRAYPFLVYRFGSLGSGFSMAKEYPSMLVSLNLMRKARGVAATHDETPTLGTHIPGTEFYVKDPFQGLNMIDFVYKDPNIYLGQWLSDPNDEKMAFGTIAATMTMAGASPNVVWKLITSRTSQDGERWKEIFPALNTAEKLISQSTGKPFKFDEFGLKILNGEEGDDTPFSELTYTRQINDLVKKHDDAWWWYTKQHGMANTITKDMWLQTVLKNTAMVGYAGALGFRLKWKPDYMLEFEASRKDVMPTIGQQPNTLDPKSDMYKAEKQLLMNPKGMNNTADEAAWNLARQGKYPGEKSQSLPDSEYRKGGHFPQEDKVTEVPGVSMKNSQAIGERAQSPDESNVKEASFRWRLPADIKDSAKVGWQGTYNDVVLAEKGNQSRGKKFLEFPVEQQQAIYSSVSDNQKKEIDQYVNSYNRAVEIDQIDQNINQVESEGRLSTDAELDRRVRNSGNIVKLPKDQKIAILEKESRSIDAKFSDEYYNIPSADNFFNKPEDMHVDEYESKVIVPLKQFILKYWKFASEYENRTGKQLKKNLDLGLDTNDFKGLEVALKKLSKKTSDNHDEAAIDF